MIRLKDIRWVLLEAEYDWYDADPQSVPRGVRVWKLREGRQPQPSPWGGPYAIRLNKRRVTYNLEPLDVECLLAAYQQEEL